MGRDNKEPSLIKPDFGNHWQPESTKLKGQGLTMPTLLPPDATMDDKLDELYFLLPIAYGKQRVFTDQFNISRATLLNWLCKLRDEGLAEYVGSRWVKCYNWAKENP